MASDINTGLWVAMCLLSWTWGVEHLLFSSLLVIMKSMVELLFFMIHVALVGEWVVSPARVVHPLLLIALALFCQSPAAIRYLFSCL